MHMGQWVAMRSDLTPNCMAVLLSCRGCCVTTQSSVRIEAAKGLSQLYGHVTLLWESGEAFQTALSEDAVRAMRCSSRSSSVCVPPPPLPSRALTYTYIQCHVSCDGVAQAKTLGKLMWIPGALLRVYLGVDDAFTRYKIVQVFDKLILPTYVGGRWST